VVRDGTTIVIGGLFRDNTRTKRGQVPLLGEIPVLGAAFRRSRDEALKQEVIILLTPHVLDDPARDAVARELLADAERIRVGMRQGLQWHGRERLAQAYFRAASDHLRQGHRSLALWEANAAIGLQPTFLDAIRMREQILDKQMSEPAGSAIKDMVMKRILQPPDEAECRSQRTDRPSPEKPAQVSAATHDTPSAGAPGPANEPSKGADGP
jgi:hypothetical protein